MADPASSNLRVPLELQSAGTTLNGKAQQVDNELRALKTKLTPIIDPSANEFAGQHWSSDAQHGYANMQGEWNLAMDGLFGETGVVTQICSALNISWNNYSDCEWTNLKTWTPT